MVAQRLHPTVPLVPSPNRHRRREKEWLATVIHFTASRPGARGDISWLCDPRASASAHFIIDRDGAITQLVELRDCAWHAGISQLVMPDGRVRKGCNEFTIGIELDNLGPLVLEADVDPRSANEVRLAGMAPRYFFEEGTALKPYDGPTPVRAELAWPMGPSFDSWWEPYPDAQLEALGKLLGWIAEAGHKEAAHNLVGHEEVSVPQGRKRDPGPLFPWERFGRKSERLTTSRLITPTPATPRQCGP